MGLSVRDHHLKITNRIKLFVCIGIVMVGLLVLLTVENMLLSCLLAFTASYLLDPCINYLERLQLSRFFATCLAFVLGLIALTILVTLTAPFISTQVTTFQSELPKYIEGTSGLLVNMENRIEGLLGQSVDLNLSERARELLASWSSSIFEDAARFLSQSLTTLGLAPFFTFFFLTDGRRFSLELLNLVPNNYFEFALSLHHQINDQMGQFIRARLLEAAIVGLVVWFGLFLIDFPFATLLALFAMLTNLIPYIGPIIGVVPAVIILLINGQTNFELFLMLGIYGLAQLIDVFFIIPLVVAKIVNLHPVTVVISIIIGAQLMGIIGMIISIPVANVLKVTTTNLYHHLVHFRV